MLKQVKEKLTKAEWTGSVENYGACHICQRSLNALCLPPQFSPSLLITTLCPQNHSYSSAMESSTHKMAGPHAQQKIQRPLHAAVGADRRFRYRPKIVSELCLRLSSHDRASVHMLDCRRQVCPRPERKYEAQIGLRIMEEQATRTAPVLRDNLAKWSLEALASRAKSHFAHLRSPEAVMNCTLCRTSIAGTAVLLDWVLTVTSTNPTARYPICSPMTRPMPTSQTSGYLSDTLVESTTEVSLESPREFMC